MIAKTIDELIAVLETLKKEHGGELPVRWDSLSHTFPPDVEVRERSGRKVAILNT